MKSPTPELLVEPFAAAFDAPPRTRPVVFKSVGTAACEVDPKSKTNLMRV